MRATGGIVFRSIDNTTYMYIHVHVYICISSNLVDGCDNVSVSVNLCHFFMLGSNSPCVKFHHITDNLGQFNIA